jgi:hypothetical protein
MRNEHTPPLDYAKASLEELYFEVVIGTGFGRASDYLHNDFYSPLDHSPSTSHAGVCGNA